MATDSARYVSVRLSLEGNIVHYNNVCLEDRQTGKQVNGRYVNGIVGLMKRVIVS